MECVVYHGAAKEIGEQILEKGFNPSSETSWLGEGVYFWQTDSIFDGHRSAEWWVKEIKKFDHWIIFKALIRSNHHFDLASNTRDQETWLRLRWILREKHTKEGNKPETFCDYFIVKVLVKEKMIDFIRAIMSENPTSNYVTHVMLYSRLVINVINTGCIVEKSIVHEGM